MTDDEDYDLEYYILMKYLNFSTTLNKYDIYIADEDKVTIKCRDSYDFSKNRDFILYDIVGADNYDMELYLQLKPSFLNFDSLELIKRSVIYQNLFSVNIDKYLKRLIFYLLSIGNTKRRRYVKMMDEELKEKIVDYYKIIYENLLIE